MAWETPVGGHDARAERLPAPAWQRLPAAVAEKVVRPVFAEVIDGVVAEVAARQGSPRGDGPLEHNLRVGLDEALEQFADLIEGRRDMPDTRPFDVLGRKQARAGLPMDELLTFYRLGGLVSWRCFSQAHARGQLEAETLGLLGEALFAYLHELSAAAAAGFSAAQVDGASLQQARRHGLVRRIVLGVGGGKGSLEQHARQAGWPLPARLAVFVGRMPTGSRPQPSWPDDVLVGAVEGQLCGLVPLSESGEHAEELLRAAAEDVPLALGPTVPLADAAASYRRACEVRELVTVGAVPAAPLVRAHDHAVATLLRREEDLVNELATTWLGPLLALPPARRGPLLETLETWLLDPGRPSAVADRLCVHVQTVRYRLRRLRQLLGDVIEDPDRRLDLLLALRAVRSR